MSWVNNAILTFNETFPCERISELNGHLGRIADTGQGFLKGCPTDQGCVGGSKGLEVDVRLAAFNYVLSSEVIEAIRATEWESPESVRLFWCDQESDAFVQVYPS